MPAPLPRTVKALGAVSLPTDVSSEMIYPLLPSFLTVQLNAGPAFLGLIEGLAEAAASLLKLAAGCRPTLLFACYGIFHAVSEGPERALVADLAGIGSRGAAFGAYHAVTGAMLLPASLLTGWLWQSYGAATSLMTGAALAGMAAIGLLVLVEQKTGSGVA